ncbi:MAG TPA: hypothetical protein VFP84_16685 [Kofleriaceae bacterium]|nr:hypothetical protein [Kofleriaceae bacterium]
MANSPLYRTPVLCLWCALATTAPACPSAHGTPPARIEGDSRRQFTNQELSHPCKTTKLKQTAHVSRATKTSKLAPSYEALTNQFEPVTINVLVVYTKAALQDFKETNETNTDAALQRLKDAVEAARKQANDTFSANKLALIVKTGMPEQIAFKESESVDASLESIAADKETAKLRKAHQADVVAFIQSGGDWAGLANGARRDLNDEESAEQALFVIQDNCIAKSFHCFTHELSHVLGAAHEESWVSTHEGDYRGWKDICRGWAWIGSDRVTYGDIMDYSAADNREFILSDPNSTNHGAASGTANANNAACVREEGRHVARYHEFLK